MAVAIKTSGIDPEIAIGIGRGIVIATEAEIAMEREIAHIVIEIIPTGIVIVKEDEIEKVTRSK